MEKHVMSEEDRKEIIQLYIETRSCGRVSDLTGWSRAAVLRVANEECLVPTVRSRKSEQTIKKWLDAHWQWKSPEEQPMSFHPAQKPKKRKSNFRTPYNQQRRFP